MSAPPQAGSSSQQQQQAELQAALKARLIQSGEMLGVLKTKLDEAGWEDKLRSTAREKARGQEPPSLNNLVKELEPHALETVPVNVRKEIEDMLQKFVEKNVEE
ncbi:hypothetical protein T439DRAFT_351730 [Meredithblackwellia eburnea MCA 4105]